MDGCLQTANKNRSRFSTEKILVVARMGYVNARLDQLDEKVNKKYAELKAEINKNNNALARLKAWIEQGISALKEDQNKTQESLDIILARLPPHTSFPPPIHNPHLDPFNTPPSNRPKTRQHNTTPLHDVPFFNIPSISIPQTHGYQIRVKLELPKFDGDEKQCIAWINKAEECFDIHHIPYDSEKIKCAAIQLKRNAYN